MTPLPETKTAAPPAAPSATPLDPASTGPASANAATAAIDPPEIIDDVLIETVSIDGMCGVY